MADNLPPSGPPSSTMADAGGAQRGDPLSWARLDERLRPWLRGILASHRLPLAHNADDVISITFAHVYRDIWRFKVEPGSSFRTWVLSIMLNRIASLVKMENAKKRKAPGEVRIDADIDSEGGKAQVADPDAEPASMLARHAELAQDFLAAIADLDPETRAILELRVLNDMEFEAIAGVVGRDKPDTVRVIFKRAMDRVRGRMRGHT